MCSMLVPNTDRIMLPLRIAKQENSYISKIYETLNEKLALNWTPCIKWKDRMRGEFISVMEIINISDDTLQARTPMFTTFYFNITYGP